MRWRPGVILVARFYGSKSTVGGYYCVKPDSGQCSFLFFFSGVAGRVCRVVAGRVCRVVAGTRDMTAAKLARLRSFVSRPRLQVAIGRKQALTNERQIPINSS